MMEAFSYAREYCEVALCVKASYLGAKRQSCQQRCAEAAALCIPCERDLDVVLVDGEPQIQQLQLSVVSIEQVAAGGAVLAGTSHVLAQAVEGGTLVMVSLRIVPVRVPDVVLERADPVDLVGLLEGAR